jgi:sugar lactone lactonase YvrE
MGGLKNSKIRLFAVVGWLCLPAFAARAQPYAFSTLAGVGCGSSDGTNSAARFFYPKGGALDALGNLYFADSGNHTIRKVTTNGVVTTLAGLAGISGSTDGAGSVARFYNPSGVAVDAGGNVYVADTGNHVIRVISSAGVVSTLAGLAGNYGAADGTNGTARFYHPTRVTLDAGGNLYVADTYNHTIRKIQMDPRSGNWIVSTLAGTAGVSGSTDGASALFFDPWDLAVDGNGNVYVADAGNSAIRVISPLGITSTYAGLSGVPGIVDGTGPSARFSCPCAITIDGNGILYVADGATATIRRITPGGAVTTVAGQVGIYGSADGLGPATLFNYPCGLVADTAGANIYIADSGNNTIRKLTANLQVTTLVGLAAGQGGSADGTNDTARFLAAQAVTVDSAGNIYAADTGNNTIRKVTPAGVVTTLAGQAGVKGSADGTNGTALFWRPTGITLDGSTNLYVADTGNHTIRKVTPAGIVTTLAGTAGVFGYADGTNGAASFRSPCGLAADAASNLYVADFANAVIRKVTPAGVVTTYAGNAATNGSADGTNTAALFLMPCGVAVDSSSNVYVADTGNHTIRVITPSGVVSTLAGLAGFSGTSDGTNSGARFCFPHGIAVDAASNVYVADTFAWTIRKITAAGVVSTIAGTANSCGVADDKGPGAQFYYPYGLAVDGASNLYVADAFNNSIRKGAVYNPPFVTADLLSQTVLGDATVTFAASAAGGDVLQYQWQANGVNIADATNATLVLDTVGVSNAVTYDYIVTSAYGSATSQVATLSVLVPPNDAFKNAVVLSGTNFSVTGSNVGATKQPGEPNHAGSPGGRSVWWSWTAPVDGTMTLDTLGSSFDTLLAVYTGSPVSSLTPLVSDDDTITVLQSQVVFGAKAGKTYRIAVDGYNSNSGSIHLNLAWAPPVPPSIISSPQPQIDIPGTTVAFSVAATGSPPLSFQWRKNGVNISGATGTILTLQNISTNDVATYDAVASDELTNAITMGAPLTLDNGATFRTMAGSAGYGGADGIGINARFHNPNAVARDSAGNLYVVDNMNDTVRKITPAGIVTTLAGLAGASGFTDGTNSGARFNAPCGICVDGAANIYVADTGNSIIRKITPGGIVTTLAGLHGVGGNSDGIGSNARFVTPSDVTADAFGDIYVADTGNNTIRFITPSGSVTTIAGTAGVAGSVDGPATNALFNFPEGITMDFSNNLYVADTFNNTIRMITAAGQVSTLAGMANVAGGYDGQGTNAAFRLPGGLDVDAARNVYVADTGNNTVRMITPDGVVSTIAGTAGDAGFSDGSNVFTLFSGPTGLTLDLSGNLFVTDDNNNLIRKITLGGVTTTIAGAIGYGDVDGTGAAARFNFPVGMVVDAADNAYISDYLNQVIRKITPTGVVTTLAGTPGTFGSIDGTNNTAMFAYPSGMAIDSSSNLYVCDTGNDTIRKVTPAGVVTTIAGTPGISGNLDGTGATALFTAPQGCAVDAATNIYVADTGNFEIRKITPAGVVTTLAGSTKGFGYYDSTGTNAQFASPTGIIVDSATNIYVADTANFVIRKISASGAVTTLAGQSFTGGFADGTGGTARFGAPYGLALDGATNLIVADDFYNTIRTISPQGMVSTLAGAAGFRGDAEGTGVGAFFSSPQQVAMDSMGNIFVADAGNYSVRTTLPGPPTLQISSVANYAVIWWPSYATGYVAEISASPIAGGAWTPLTNLPVVLVGSNFVQSNPISTPFAVYRLHKSQ